MNETLSRRIETCLDRWNKLPRQQRHELSGIVTSTSLGLGELGKLTRELGVRVAELEDKLRSAEENVEPDPDEYNEN